MNSALLEALQAGAVMCALAAVYLIPTIIAGFRRHRNGVAILVVNFFLGWTLLGWILALVWAVWEEKR